MFENLFGDLMKDHRDREDEYNRLRSDEPKLLRPGDKVLVALGLLGYGFNWIREKGEIKDVKTSSVRVIFEKTHIITKEPLDMWIDPVLITDVIERATASATPE